MRLSKQTSDKKLEFEIGEATLITATACFFTTISLVSAWYFFNRN